MKGGLASVFKLQGAHVSQLYWVSPCQEEVSVSVSWNLRFWRNNVVFVLVMEHWSSSLFPQGYLKVYQGMPNQSTCVERVEEVIEPHPSWCPMEAPSGVSGLLLWGIWSLYNRCQSLVVIAENKSDFCPLSLILCIFCLIQTLYIGFFLTLRCPKHASLSVH